MERPVFQAPGTPMEELDTPALVVDLEVMERNIATVHACFSQSSAKIRPMPADINAPRSHTGRSGLGLPLVGSA